jgi:hypothetical protein
MAYIGNTPAEAFSAFQKQDFSTSATTSYTLDHPVSNQNEIALFINFVRQEPTAAYTASGTTLTLTSATSSSDDMYCVYLGKAVQTVNPPSGSVGSSQVAASIITGQTELATAPASTDELLISDAGVLKRIDVSLIGGTNTPAFEAILSSATTINHDTPTKVQCNTEIFDTASAYDNSSNFRFTPQVAGKYFVYAKVRIDSSPGNCEVVVSYIYKNGSNYTFSLIDFDNNDGEGGTTNQASVIDFNGSSDYVELYAYGKNASGSGTLNLEGASSGYPTVFGAYKIIE